MHHPTLTKVRTAKLVADLHALRLRVLAKPDGEHSYAGVATFSIGLENILADLVHDLAGPDALGAVQQALDATFSPEAIAAYRAQAAARQAAFVARNTAPTKAQACAYYQLQAALANVPAAGA